MRRSGLVGAADSRFLIAAVERVPPSGLTTSPGGSFMGFRLSAGAQFRGELAGGASGLAGSSGRIGRRDRGVLGQRGNLLGDVRAHLRV